MVDFHALNDILSARNGVWATFLLLCVLAWRGWSGLPAIMAQWTARRQAIAAEKAADWDRLRDEVKRLAGRIDTLEQKVSDCEQREAEWRTRAITAEAEVARQRAIELGMGQGRQIVQEGLSATRLAEADRKRRENGSEGK